MLKESWQLGQSLPQGVSAVAKSAAAAPRNLEVHILRPWPNSLNQKLGVAPSNLFSIKWFPLPEFSNGVSSPGTTFGVMKTKSIIAQFLSNYHQTLFFKSKWL
jgi:hypothetical protein